ncbi:MULTISPECIES: hypothetical protein [Amycolatopsis]|uniref:hypothetical protein n=1 Tax=Amycolatopsis TaxID=1813 RepID=UPI000B8B7F4F|nr:MULTISPECIES: hypothetical protein [Amycolatopsis]OXM73326.1 hypothetical protein CF166_10315 [Amycolatopsis sp. KNN50.9b]
MRAVIRVSAAGLFARTGVAGVVEEAGAGVAFTPEDAVIGLRTRPADPLGAWAEHIVLDADAVAPAPDGADPPGDRRGRRVRGRTRRAARAPGGRGRERARRGENLAEGVRKRVPGGVDGAIDAAVLGYPALDAVKDGGAFVAVIGNGPDNYRGIRIRPVRIKADGVALTGLSRLAAAGHLTWRWPAPSPWPTRRKRRRGCGTAGCGGVWSWCPNPRGRGGAGTASG